ncbi:hypothetical protein JGG47_23230 [Salmonella enterica subsp. enterica serovar Derby]|nr:hypothetical protein [Salmonella enterica subsp. enterica serovar Derby]
MTARRKTTAAKVTAEFNAHLQNPVSTHTVQRELHKQHIHDRAAISKPLVSQMNMKRRLQWCQEHKTWTAEQWKHVLFSDGLTFTLFPTAGRVYVWRTPAEAYNPDCLLPRVKHGGGFIMVWAMISWFAAGPIITFHGRINSGDYVTILADHVHSMAQTLFPSGDCTF